MGFGFARSGIGAGTSGLEFGEESGVEVVSFAGMPFAPAVGVNVSAQFGVEVNDGSIGAPGAAEINTGHSGLSSHSAMVEDECAPLGCTVSALCGEVTACSVFCVVDLAVVEDGVAVTVDVIHIAGDYAMGEVAARSDRDAGSWLSFGR